jgi:hypothetical protein
MWGAFCAWIIPVSGDKPRTETVSAQLDVDNQSKSRLLEGFVVQQGNPNGR